MAGNANFWNRMAKGYAKSQIKDQASYEKKLEVTQSYFTPQMEVLEIGCGTGSTALIHAPKVRHIRATDISENMIAIAREKAEAQGVKNVAFEVASIDDVDMPENSLDMVQAHSILHLIENRQETIARVFKGLKPGGLFVTSTVCMNDGFGFFKYVLPLGRMLGLLPYLSFFTARELERDFLDAGFVVDHKWRPGPKKAIFMILKKPA